MKTKEIISTEDMTNWLQAQRISSTTEGNLYEEIIVAIAARLKHYDTLLAFNEKVRNVTLEPKK